MRKSQLIRPSIGVTWTTKKRKKKLMKKIWRLAFNLSIACQAPRLVLRRRMSLTSGSSKERNLRGLFTRFLKKNKRQLLQGLFLEQRTSISASLKLLKILVFPSDMWLALALKISLQPKGLTFLEARKQIELMLLYNLKNWMLWMKFCLGSTRKHERRRSCVANVRILVTRWERMRRNESGRCKRRRANQRKRISSLRLFCLAHRKCGKSSPIENYIMHYSCGKNACIIRCQDLSTYDIQQSRQFSNF